MIKYILGQAVYDSTVSNSNSSIDPNGLGACISRAQDFPAGRMGDGPVSASDLIPKDDLPVLISDYCLSKRLNQVQGGSTEPGSKRRGTSLIQPNRGRRGSNAGSFGTPGSMNSSSGSSGFNESLRTPDTTFLRRPTTARTQHGLRAAVPARSLAAQNGSVGAAPSPALFGEYILLSYLI